MTLTTGYPDWQPRVVPTGTLDQLYSNLSLPAGGSFNTTVNVTKQYAGLKLVFSCHVAMTVTINAAIGGAAAVTMQMTKFCVLAGERLVFIYPAPMEASSGFVLTITTSVSMASSGVVVSGYNVLPPVQMRSDGRPYPLGINGIYNQVAAASVTLIPAPASPARIMLASLTLQAFTAGAIAAIDGVINGAAARLLYVGGEIAVPQPIPPQGVLLDQASAVTLTWAAGSSLATALYDIVI